MHSAPPPSAPARDPAQHHQRRADDLLTIRRLCQQRGLILTLARRRVLRVLIEAARPLKAYDILEVIRRTQPGAAATSIYRALEFLQAHGWVVKLNAINAWMFLSPGASKRCTFLVCETCSHVQTVHGLDTGANWMIEARITGFVPATQSIEISGQCAGCRAATGLR